MTPKNRLLISIAIITIIGAALFMSFGRNLFANSIPSVSLPAITDLTDPLHPDTDWHNPSDPLPPIEVTIETAQEVVRSLKRTDSYLSEQTITLYAGEESLSYDVSVWRNKSWTATQQTTPQGNVRNDLIGSDVHYYWYDDDRSYLTAPLNENSADLSQHIPTYEDIAELDVKTIKKAAFSSYNNEIPCIYIEVSPDPTSVSRYWISTVTGLLISAEVERNGSLIYALVADAPIQTPCPTDAPFLLPDGTSVLNSLK